MKIEVLPVEINDEIQHAMVDVFESLGDVSGSNFSATSLMVTMPHFMNANEILHGTDFLSKGDHGQLLEVINKNVDEKSDQVPDKLLYSWIAMKGYLDEATSQDDFNARFALFVPVICDKMTEMLMTTKPEGF